MLIALSGNFLKEMQAAAAADDAERALQRGQQAREKAESYRKALETLTQHKSNV